MVAACEGRTEVVQCLLQAGVDMNMQLPSRAVLVPSIPYATPASDSRVGCVCVCRKS